MKETPGWIKVVHLNSPLFDLLILNKPILYWPAGVRLKIKRKKNKLLWNIPDGLTIISSRIKTLNFESAV